MEPDTSIMDMVNNTEALYNDKNALYDKWIGEGESWSEAKARRQAHALVRHFAQAIVSDKYIREFRWKYTEKDYQEAVDEMIEGFDEYKEYEIQDRIKQTTRVAKPEELAMDAGDIEHAKKYEELAQKIGVEQLKALIPATPEQVRTALSRGDKHLNTIKLKKWDDATFEIRVPGLSISEKVCILKHVATWHYA